MGTASFVVDLVVIVLVAVMAWVGHRQGAVAALLTLFGFALGTVAGGGVARLLLEGGRSSAYLPLAILVGALSFAILFSTVLHDVYALAREHHAWREPPLDQTIGAVLGGLVGLGACWAAAAVIVTSPSAGVLRSRVLDSGVLLIANQVVPPPSGLFGALVQHDPLPTLDAGRVHIDAPPDDVPSTAVLRAAVNSVVQVRGTACGYGITGSGWVAAPHLIVTNVHVVAGEHDTTVRLHGGRTLRAVPVAIEPGDDIAVLRVAGLHLPALRAASTAKGGTAGVVVGYPEHQGRTIVPARLGVRERVRTSDASGRNQVDRALVEFRGRVRHGNSGGPLLNGAGEVLGTVFAATGGTAHGGFAVPNDVVESIVADAGTTRVDSRCGGA